MKRPTLIDVAGLAGVSRATAARVLGGAGNVDPAMTRAVHAAAEKLGYQTNAAARSLRSGRTGSVALILAINELDGLAGPFTTGPLKGATSVLSAAGIQPALLPAGPLDGERIAHYLAGGHVDGAVVILQHEISDIVAHLAPVRQPIVYVGRPLDRTADASPVYVDSDNYGGGRMAARALIAAGRTRIATIAGPSDMQAAIDRLAGWRDELAESGRSEGGIVHGEFTMASGAEAMSRLLTRQPDLDGLFAASDLMAIGASRVLAASGRAVPRDVSLIGFDDTVLAATSEPPLTTIRQPLEELGRTAAEVVLRLIADPRTVEPIVLPTQLVQRDSV